MSLVGEEQQAGAAPPPLEGAPPATPLPPPAAGAPMNAVDAFMHHLSEAGLDLRACLQEADREDEAAARAPTTSSSSGPIGISSWRMREPHTFKNKLERHMARVTKMDITLSDERHCQRASGDESFAQDRRHFLQLLLPTQPAHRPFTLSQRHPESRPTVTYAQQDSLMRLLLLVEQLQLPLVKFLLLKLQEIRQPSPRDPHPLAPLILSQLRFLDQVYDSTAIASAFNRTAEKIHEQEVLSAMIQAVPEIISQQDHQYMVPDLIKLYRHDDRQIVSVLDTLPNLQMSAAKTREVIAEMLATLTNKPIADLPVIVKFIVQSSGNLAEMRGVGDAPAPGPASAPNAAASSSGHRGAPRKVQVQPIEEELAKTLAKLREQLNLSRLVTASEDAATIRRQQKHQQPRQAAAHSTGNQRQQADNLTAPSLTIQLLQQSIRFHPFVGDVWLKELKKLKASDDHTTVDLWMVFLLYEVPNLRDKVFAMVKKKIADGALRTEQMERAIEEHETVMHSLFKTILQFCDALLRTSDARCHRVGVRLQSACFAAFPAQADRSKVVSAFVQQIGNTTQKDTCNAALAELWQLAHRHADAVGLYQEEVSMIVEYMTNFTPEQITILAEILAVVAVNITPRESGGGGREADMEVDGQPSGVVSSPVDLTISSKFRIACVKNFGSNVLIHHRIGIYFVAALLKYIAAPILAPETSELQLRASNAAQQFEELWGEVLTLIDKLAPVHAETRRSQLFHLMAKAIEAGAIHSAVLPLLAAESEKVLHEYLSGFHLPLRFEPDAAQQEAVECTPDVWLNLDPAPEKIVALLPRLADPQTRPYVHRLSAGVRLYLACAKQDRTLASLEHLAGAPLFGFDLAQMKERRFGEETPQDSQYLVVSTVLHALNFHRSIVSAFAAPSSSSPPANAAAATEHQALVGTRLRHCMRLELKLKRFVEVMSDLAFVPYGLSEDDADEVIDAAEKLAEKLRDKSSKADGGGGSKRKVKEVSKEEYFESMKQLLQPISFDVFSLFNMPLSLQADHALTTCFRHHPSTKKPKLAGAAAAAEAAAARATELQVLPMAEETLSIELLAHLLADLRARIGVAVDRQEDPLLAVKFDPPNTGEGDVAPQNTADAMNPWELTQAMMARWAALGSHAHAIMLHLRAHHDTDETTEDGEDGAGGGGTPEFARRETMFACLESLVGVSRFLLKYAPPEDELGETMRQALALFVSTFDESATESLTLSSGGGRKKVAPGSLAYSCQSLMYLLGGIGECTTELACCKVVLEAMEAVLQVADHEAKAHWQLYRGLRQPLQAVVSTYARALLEETWDENTKLNASNVGYAMKLTLECAQEFDDTCDDMLQTMSRILSHHRSKSAAGSSELDESDAKFARNLTLKSAPLYFRPLLESLGGRLLRLSSSEYSSMGAGDFFREFARLAHLLSDFTQLIKRIYVGEDSEVGSTPLYASVLRQGRAIMEGIVKHHRVVFESHLKAHKVVISQLLLHLQQYATLMQTVCQYGKLHAISGLSAHIPPAKAASQAFLSMVRLIFGANGIQSALTSRTIENQPKLAAPKKRQQKAKGGKKRKKGDESEEEEDEEEKAEADEEEEDDAAMEDVPDGEPEEEAEEEEEEDEDVPVDPEETDMEDGPPPQKKRQKA